MKTHWADNSNQTLAWSLRALEEHSIPRNTRDYPAQANNSEQVGRHGSPISVAIRLSICLPHHTFTPIASLQEPASQSQSCITISHIGQFLGKVGIDPALPHANSETGLCPAVLGEGDACLTASLIAHSGSPDRLAPPPPYLNCTRAQWPAAFCRQFCRHWQIGRVAPL